MIPQRQDLSGTGPITCNLHCFPQHTQKHGGYPKPSKTTSQLPRNYPSVNPKPYIGLDSMACGTRDSIQKTHSKSTPSFTKPSSNFRHPWPHHIAEAPTFCTSSGGTAHREMASVLVSQIGMQSIGMQPTARESKPNQQEI